MGMTCNQVNRKVDILFKLRERKGDCSFVDCCADCVIKPRTRCKDTVVLKAACRMIEQLEGILGGGRK